MKLEWVEVPRKVGYEQAWDDAYAKMHYEEYKRWHRFPEVLAPESDHVWFWRHVYSKFYAFRRAVWYSRIIQHLYRGYTPDEWTYRFVGKERRWRSKVKSRVPMRIQRLFRWFCGGRQAPIRKWWVSWLKTDDEYDICPNCGQYQGDFNWNDWYHCTSSGTAFTGDYTQHWFDGIWTCRRCLFQWEYGDSD